MDRLLLQIVETDVGSFVAQIQVFDSDNEENYVTYCEADEPFETRRAALEWATTVDFDDE